jgi:hypothetical protein
VSHLLFLFFAFPYVFQFFFSDLTKEDWALTVKLKKVFNIT